MTTKTCNLCSGTFPATQEFFSFFTNRGKNGTTTGLRGTCKKCMAARTALHSKENPDLVAERAARRRKIEAAAEGTYSQDDVSAIRRMLNDECYYCGISLKGTGDIDHMTSLSRGGTNWPSNLTLACKTCNLDKHSKNAEEFFQWRRERNLPVREASWIRNRESTTGNITVGPRRSMVVKKKL